LDDYLNTAQAQAAVFEMARAANAAFDAGEVSKTDVPELSEALHKFQEVYPVIADDDAPTIQWILHWARSEGREKGITPELLELGGWLAWPEADIEKKIAEMNAVRTARNFKEPDRLRTELTTAGIVVENTKDGVRWRRK